jgi:hypothetical protein
MWISILQGMISMSTGTVSSFLLINQHDLASNFISFCANFRLFLQPTLKKVTGTGSKTENMPLADKASLCLSIFFIFRNIFFFAICQNKIVWQVLESDFGTWYMNNVQSSFIYAEVFMNPFFRYDDKEVKMEIKSEPDPLAVTEPHMVDHLEQQKIKKQLKSQADPLAINENQ